MITKQKVSHAKTMSSASISSPDPFPFPFPFPMKNDDDDESSDHSSSSFFNYHRNDNRYDLNGRIMLTAIISLSAVVFLVLALHVYARYALRRHARRRREALLSRLSLSASPAATSSTSSKPRGLDPVSIASLPLSSLSSDDCAVCLGAVAEGEPARLLPGCGHAFHAECIDIWLASQASCPVCRAVVDPPPLRPEPREGPSAPPLLGSSSYSGVEVGMTSSSSSSSRCGGGGKAMLSGSSRFSSFRRMITAREKLSSSRRDQEIVDEDLERQS